jgi:glycine betaine catabolism A
MWFYVGRAEALAEPGAYQTVTVGQESIIIVRDRDLELHAFLNVCRHRGARVCKASSGHLKGSLQCPYHAWTYGLDGRLIGAPNILDNEEFDRSRFGLIPVALEVWEGLIWLNLSDDPRPFLDQIHGPVIERFGDLATFSRYQLGNLRLGRSISYDVKANWKLIIENALECYHCGPVHPELCQVLPSFKSGKSYVSVETATLAEGVEAFSMTGKASLPHLPGLLPEDLRRYYGFIVPPNVMFNFLDDHVVIQILYPQDSGHTRIVCDWLFDPDAMASPGFDPTDAVELFDRTNRQDWEICELTQLGMTSKAFRSGGIYVPVERHIRNFADFVLEALKG